MKRRIVKLWDAEWFWFTGLIISIPFIIDDSLIFFGILGFVNMLIYTIFLFMKLNDSIKRK